MRTGYRPFLLSALALALVSHEAAASDWPAARHDSAHTAASPGTLPAGIPTVVWRAYLGGRPNGDNARFGLGSPSLLFAARGGRFIAKDVNTQATLFQSPLLGPGTIAAFANLLGNGGAQAVIRTEEFVYALDAATGSVLWQSPPGAFGRIAEVRVLDLNGDQIDDIYIDDGSGGKTGLYSAAAYSFSSGFNTPIELWNRPFVSTPPSVNAGTDALFDLNGDGIPEIFLAAYKEALLVRGDTGAPITLIELPNGTGNPFAQATAIAADLHPQLPGKELIAVQPNGQVVNSGGPPALMVYSINPLVSNSSVLLWQASTQDYEAEIVQSAEMVSDFDGNGTSEVVFSFRSPLTGMAWITDVLKGSDGSLIQRFSSARFEGAADLDGNPGAELVLADASGLFALALQNGVFVPIGPHLPGLRALTFQDPIAAQHAPLARRLAVIHRAGQPPELLAGQPAPGNLYADLNSLSSFSNTTNLTLNANGWITGNTYTPAVGIITDVLQSDYATRPYEQMALGTSFGTVDVLDSDMELTNGGVALGQPPLGTRIGGTSLPSMAVSEGPLIAHDSEGPIVVLPGSPKGLNVANAKYASMVVEPQSRWIAPKMSLAAVLPPPPGQIDPWIAGFEGSLLVARASADGSLKMQRDLGNGHAAAPPFLLHQNGVPGPIAGVDFRTPGVQIVQWAVDLGTNTLLSKSAPIAFGGFYASGAGDVNGDGNDEWYWVANTLQRRPVNNASSENFPSIATGYAIPVIAPFTGNPLPDVLLSGSIQGPVLVSPAMQKTWEAPLPEAMNVMAGTRAECAGQARFITPALQSPVLRAYEGATGALLFERVLAGGQVFPSLAQAQAAGHTPGMLSNASSVANVLPAGTPSVLVGSTDGFLYALDACSMNLSWAADLGAPVSEPVIGDSDGDGLSEIIAGAADGYVYGLDFPLLIPPGDLWFEGADAHKNRTLAVGETAHLHWSKSPGADFYELSLTDPEGRPLWDPPYRSAPFESAEIPLEGALAGRPYRVLVRARLGDSASADAASGALFIADHTKPSLRAEGSTEGPARVHIAIAAEDDLALSHFVIRFADVNGSIRRVAADGPAPGKTLKTIQSLSISSEFFGKTIEMECQAADSGLNTSAAVLKAEISQTGEVHWIKAQASSDSAAEKMPQIIGGCGIARENENGQWARRLLLAAALLRLARRRRK